MEGGYPLDLSHLPSQSQHMAGMRDDAFIHDASMAWGQGLEVSPTNPILVHSMD